MQGKRKKDEREGNGRNKKSKHRKESMGVHQ